MQRKLKQTKVYHKFFDFVRNETTHKPLKVAAPKTLFPIVYVIGKTYFDEYFLLHLTTERHYFSFMFIFSLR